MWRGSILGKKETNEGKEGGREGEERREGGRGKKRERRREGSKLEGTRAVSSLPLARGRLCFDWGFRAFPGCLVFASAAFDMSLILILFSPRILCQILLVIYALGILGLSIWETVACF